jgi:hypothetical protein
MGFIMNIPYARWYEAIGKRRSYRTYDKNRPVEAEKLAALDAVCKEFPPFTHARACLVTESVEKVFRGLVGAYGKVKNAPAFIVFVGNTESPFYNEQTGYTGEGLILEAAALGLDTCWVGGAFSRENVASLIEVGNTERVLAVSPVGYAIKSETFEDKIMAGFGRHHKRLPVDKLVSGLSYEQSPDWIKSSIEAARLAPSALNRQPWGFDIEEDAITVYIRSKGTDTGIPFRLDCGIAMLHMEVAALNAGYKGRWEFLQSPQVARFRVG